MEPRPAKIVINPGIGFIRDIQNLDERRNTKKRDIKKWDHADFPEEQGFSKVAKHPLPPLPPPIPKGLFTDKGLCRLVKGADRKVTADRE